MRLLLDHPKHGCFSYKCRSSDIIHFIHTIYIIYFRVYEAFFFFQCQLPILNLKKYLNFVFFQIKLTYKIINKSEITYIWNKSNNYFSGDRYTWKDWIFILIYDSGLRKCKFHDERQVKMNYSKDRRHSWN